jgi:hypothetical protein
MKSCFAARCSRSIPRQLLMCFHHWQMVPPAIQRDVYRTLRAIDSPGGTRAYVVAAWHAQLAVAEAEGLADCAAAIRAEITAAEQTGASHES